MGMNRVPEARASVARFATSFSTVSAAVFAAGLAVVLWVAAGYAASSPLALVVLALITAAYFVGGRELWRLEQDTAAAAPSRISTRTCRPCSVSTAASPASAARVSSGESSWSCFT